MWKFLIGVVLGNDAIRGQLLKCIMSVGDYVNDKYFTTPTETVNVGENYEVMKDDTGGNDRNSEKGVSDGC